MIRRLFQLFALALTLVLGASLGFAQAVPDEYKACADAVGNAARSSDGKTVGATFRTMRSSCAQFRSCKRNCRKTKRSCKSDARAGKRECKNGCSGLRGKAKRRCKRSCRKGKRAAKRDCRKTKRSCKSTCVAQFRSGACSNARRDFWKAVGKFGAAQAKGVVNGCKEAYPRS